LIKNKLPQHLTSRKIKVVNATSHLYQNPFHHYNISILST
jgi:hypothetical protein